MEVELGFQANCSELVTHLGISNKAQAVKALVHISELTGWTWWTEVRRHYIPIDNADLPEVVAFHGGRIGADLFKMLSLDGDKLPKGLRDRPSKNESLSLYLGKQKTLEDFEGHSPSFDLWVSWNGRMLEFTQQHVAVQAFPAFHAIRMAHNSDFRAEDGGSDYYYVEWMSYYFHDKKATFAPQTDRQSREYSQKRIEILEAHPPIDRSQALTEKDRQKVLEFLRPG